MNNNLSEIRPIRARRAAAWLMRAAALALLAALAMPARAADERAVKSRVPPTYPEIAKRMRISGVVRLQITVDPEGKVTSVKPLGGNSMLSAAAQEAVRRWKYEPASADSTLEVSVNFSL